jgi:guanylate kinase
MRKKAMIIILSAPSGCGKSSIAEQLVKNDSNIALSISCTTRKPRPGEIDGVHYFFKTLEDFKNTEYLETAEIYGNLYGTPLQLVQDSLAKGKDVLFDIDYQGATQIMEKSVAKVVSIFIMPPTMDALKQRLITRGQDNENVIRKRMEGALKEIEYAKYYDHVVVNDDFSKAVQDIEHIIHQTR